MPEKKRLTVEIDADLLEWYKENFPARTLWYGLNSLLREFKNAYESEPMDTYYRKGAKALKNLLDNDPSLLETTDG